MIFGLSSCWVPDKRPPRMKIWKSSLAAKRKEISDAFSVGKKVVYHKLTISQYENSKDFCWELSSVTSLDTLVEAVLHSATYFSRKECSQFVSKRASKSLLLSPIVTPNVHWLLWLRWPCWCPCPQCLPASRTKAPGHRCSLSVAFFWTGIISFKVKVIVYSWKWHFCSPLLNLPITFRPPFLFLLFTPPPKKHCPKLNKTTVLPPPSKAGRRERRPAVGSRTATSICAHQRSVFFLFHVWQTVGSPTCVRICSNVDLGISAISQGFSICLQDWKATCGKFPWFLQLRV